MPIITAPSGLKAEIIVENAWGHDRKSLGLHYIGEEARRRLKHAFINDERIPDLRDIAADMQEYKFGYVDEVDISAQEIMRTANHPLAMTYVGDDPRNSLWHADKMWMLGFTDAQRFFDPAAVTFLYPEHLEDGQQRETGFADPAMIADIYNEYFKEENAGPIAEATAASLREIADVLAKDMRDASTTKEQVRVIVRSIGNLARHTYKRMETILDEQGMYGMHWLSHQPNRLMLFSNSIVHANDWFRRGPIRKPREHRLCRRMLLNQE